MSSDQNKKKHLKILYFQGVRAVIGYINHKKSDQYALVMTGVGEVVDQAMMTPQGAGKQFFIVGIGTNMGPVASIDIQVNSIIYSVDVTEKNLGLAAYTRMNEIYAKFCSYSERDMASNVAIPTAQEMAKIKSNMNPVDLNEIRKKQH